MSCSKQNRLEEKIAEVPVHFEVERFDSIFAAAAPADLPRLKQEYPLFFPQQFPDSLWVAKMKDSVNRELNREVKKYFPDFENEKQDLKRLFQHLKYYYPEFKPPKVITMVSEVDYYNKIILTDSLLLISLDVYLGSEHRFYTGIQRYFAKNFVKEQMVPDVAQAYARYKVPQPDERSFVNYMVYYGKQLYFKQLMIPEASPAVLMGYKEEEWEWAETNERQIWGYIIEQELLYDTHSDLRRKFFDQGPFTRFGLELDHESPAQLGRYMGWKIVNQFAQKHKELSLQELLKTDNTVVFQESNYKPKQD